MHLNCPHCQNPIEVIVEDRAEEVVCPSCGSSIQLDPGRTKTYLPDQAPRRLGKFEFLEQLGVGGYGTVYKARDTELDRTVAIKIPRAGNLATQEDVDRFLREARAAAQLEHPSIVSVHDAGQSDGTCYLVSELVQGTTLSDRLATKRLSFREAAELLAQVADALDYAHRQGVIHRDLKPSNIMLDLEGQPHIMDFGLAKREAGEITMTLDGQVLGTPAYMSPEQARGEGHDVDARSDVYSLGVILYKLLTGELPFRGNKRMLIVQVLQDEPRPPRRLNDHIPRDLETITLKCMAKEPARRYAMARDLAADLRRWLADEPILARPIGATQRLWRWAKRKPVVASLMGSVALLLLALAIGSVLFALHQQATVRQMAAKNLELEQANQRERDATLLAQKNERMAEENATKADQNAAVARDQSQLALKSLESVIFEIQRKLINVRGARELQRSLLQTAIARLQEVSERFASRVVIDRNTAVALNDLGDVLLRIGSGMGPGGPNADGPLTAAGKVYEQAFDITVKLAAADPSDAEVQRLLSLSYGRVGDVKRQFGDSSEALAAYQRCLEISRKLAEADPSDAQAQRDLSTSLERVAMVYEKTSKLGDARRYYDEMLKIKQRLADNDPNDALAQRELSVAFGHIGDVQLQSGLVTEALAIYQKTLKISQKLVAADPTDAHAQRILFASYHKVGIVQLQFGQATEAITAFQKCLDISQKLAEADPSDVQSQRDLSAAYIGLGDAQLESGGVKEALAAFQNCLEFCQKLAESDPSDAEAQRAVSLSYDRIGNVQLRSGQLPQALAAYQKCLEISQNLAEVDPTDAQVQRDLSIAYQRVGDVQLKCGELTEAIVAYQKCLEISQRLAKADPSDAQAQRDVSTSLERVAISYEKTGKLTDARRHYEEMLKIKQRLADYDPNDALAQRELSVTFGHLGDVQLQSGQVTESLDSYQKTVDITQKLAVANPSGAQAQRDLSVSYGRLADAQLRAGQVTEALASHLKGLVISQKLAAADPSDVQYQLDLYNSLAHTASAHQTAKQFEKGIACYQQALEVLQRLEQAHKLAPTHRGQVAVVQRRIQQCQLASMAMGDWNTLVEQPADVLPVLLEMRGIDSVRVGRVADAVQSVAKLRELGTATAGQLYNAACVYSLCAAAIKPEKDTDKLTAEQSATRQQHIADALGTLREAIAAGWKDFAHMQKDPDLAPLRDLPEFKALLQK